jgi:hypothetical protein
MTGDESIKMKGIMFPEGAFLERMWSNRPKAPVPEKKPVKPKKVAPVKPHIDLTGIFDGINVTCTVVNDEVKLKINTSDTWLKVKKNYYDKGHRPPIGMVSAAMRSWGCSKEVIDWTIKRHMETKHDPSWEDDFNRFYSSEKKSAAKKKALKAVVKR